MIYKMKCYSNWSFFFFLIFYSNNVQVLLEFRSVWITSCCSLVISHHCFDWSVIKRDSILRQPVNRQDYSIFRKWRPVSRARFFAYSRCIRERNTVISWQLTMMVSSIVHGDYTRWFRESRYSSWEFRLKKK